MNKKGFRKVINYSNLYKSLIKHFKLQKFECISQNLLLNRFKGQMAISRQFNDNSCLR